MFDDDSSDFVTNLGPIHLWVEPTLVVLNNDESLYVLDNITNVMSRFMRQEFDSFRFIRFLQQDDIQITFNSGQGAPSRRKLMRNSVIRNELESRNSATIISIPGIRVIFDEEVPEVDSMLRNKLTYAVASSFTTQYRSVVSMAVSDIDSNFPWYVIVSWGKDLPLTAPIIPSVITPEIRNKSKYTLVVGAVAALLAVVLFVGYRRRRNTIDRESFYFSHRLRTESTATAELHGLDFLYEQGSKNGGFPHLLVETWVDEHEGQHSKQNTKCHVGEQVIVPVDSSDVSSVTTDRSAYRFPLSIQDQETLHLTRVQQDLYGETCFGFERLGARPPSLLSGDLSLSSASDLSVGSEMGNDDINEVFSDANCRGKQDRFINSPMIGDPTSKQCAHVEQFPVFSYDDDQSSVGDILRPVV